MNELLKFIKSVFSESDGSGSSSRVMMGLIVAFILGIGVAFGTMVHFKAITIDQFNSFLHAGGEFIVTTAGPLYGVNKFTDVLKKNGNN
jgi:hypothetical protein